MNKKLLNAIPYVVLLIGIGLTLFATTTMVNIDNTCNEHWIDQFKTMQAELKGLYPTHTFPDPINITKLKFK